MDDFWQLYVSVDLHPNQDIEYPVPSKSPVLWALF